MIKTFLRIVAIIITIAGFYGNKADKFPQVLKIIEPQYAQSKEGFKIILSNKKTLVAQDPGFKEITEFLRKKIKPKEIASSVVFEKLERGSGGTKYGITATSFIDLNIYTQNNPMSKYDLLKLENELDTEFASKLLKVSHVIFWCGIFLSIASIFYK